MDFVRIEEFLDDVMPEVAGCTEFAAIDRLRRSAIEFCQKTLVSQETIEELDLTADDSILPIPSPSNQVLMYRILWMRNPQRFMTVSNRRMLANRNIDWKDRGESTSDYPYGYVLLNREEAEIFPTPKADASGVIDVHCAFIPNRECSRLDSILIDEHRDAIAAGALSHLLRMSKESWYNPEEGTAKEADFRALISNARAAVNKDRTTADTKVQMVRFA